MSDVRNLAVLATLSTLSATVGCSDDTGIIIEVTRDAERSPDGIVELVFYVGTPMPGDPQSYMRDPSDADTVLLAEGRDVLDEPYRMLLRPSDGFDTEVGAFVLGYTSGRGEVAIGALADPVPFMDGTITVWPVTLAANGRITPTDTGCLSWKPEDDSGEQIVISPDDLDCDEDPNLTDCDPDDPSVGHGRPEDCSNGIDDNCNDDVDEPNDNDEDGFFDCEDDCDDNDDRINPDADEACDGIDNDCDGDCDVDGDGDDYTSCAEDFPASDVCFQPSAGDCDDDNELVHPDQVDGCVDSGEDGDTIDDDCDDLCDEDADQDSDTFTPCGSIAGVCGPKNPADIDCDDENEHMFPGNTEVCDGFDNDCDGLPFEVPDSAECFGTTAINGSCHVGALSCIDVVGGDPGFVCEVGNDAGTLVPPAMCDAFDACIQANEPDPFACAIDTADLNAIPVPCTVAYSVDDQDICPDGQVDVPPPPGDPAQCGWRILGRPINDAYQVSLGDETGTVGQAINFCDLAVFFTESSFFFPPVEDDVLLWQHGGGTTFAVFRLTLTPVTVAEACPEEPLVCDFGN